MIPEPNADQRAAIHRVLADTARELDGLVEAHRTDLAAGVAPWEVVVAGTALEFRQRLGSAHLAQLLAVAVHRLAEEVSA